MSDQDNENMDKVRDYIDSHKGDSIIGQVFDIKTEIDSLRTDISDITGSEKHEDGLIGNLIEILGSNKSLIEYAKLSLKDEKSLTARERINLFGYEVLLGSTCDYFTEFKNFLKNLKDGGDVSRDNGSHKSITPDSSYEEDVKDNENKKKHDRQMEREQQKWNPRKYIEGSIFDKRRDEGRSIPREKVQEARDYILNGGTFYSPTKGRIKWGENDYKHVCSTGSYNVLWRLGFPKVSNSLNVDLDGTILPKMGLTYIGTVNPDDPEKNGYKPQDGDTAVWPRFTRDSGYKTQHQATYINGRRVSDTIQNNMSCYNDKNEPRNVKIYRYKGGTTRA